MSFKSAKHEAAIMVHAPSIWRRWVKIYGHHPSFQSVLKKRKRTRLKGEPKIKKFKKDKKDKKGKDK